MHEVEDKLRRARLNKLLFLDFHSDSSDVNPMLHELKGFQDPHHMFLASFV